MTIGLITKLAKYANRLIFDAGIRTDLQNSVDGASHVLVRHDDANALSRTLQSAYRGIVRVEDYVTYGDGRDEGAQLQKALDYAYTSGKLFLGRPGWRVGSSVTININCKMNYSGNGMNIVPSGMTSGLLIKISGTTAGVGTINGLCSRVTPGTVGTLTGVQIGDLTGEVSGLTFNDWDLYGHDVNLRFFGKNVFILNFEDCGISGATLRNISYECTSNSGENIRFNSGSISNAKNSTNSAVALYVAPGTSAPDIRLNDVSMSYNDWNGDIAVGIVEVYGCHEENKNTNPFWRVRNTVGGEKTSFIKIVGTMTPGPLSAGQEPAVGRDCYILYDGSTTVVVRDPKLGNFHPATGASAVADYVTKVVKHSGVGGNAYRLRVTGNIDANADTGIPLDIGTELNQAFLTGTDAFAGFTQNTSSNITFGTGTDGAGGDTRHRSITGVIGSGTGGTASYNLKVPIKPGQTVIAKVYCKTVGATLLTEAGCRLIYYTANDIQVASADLARFIRNTDNAAYTRQFIRSMAPAGAAYCTLQMRVTGLIGEARFSNESLWAME